ncbi:uncharacterized protein [Rutidosis leptorrhynchoides]|uniref:uncharacterized protein n=1 Tax=Rutidosis leptorrhynchoides TaxID=125765 RepID=UPI003A992A49
MIITFLDIPLGGRAFDDGIKFSKIGRFLVTENFYQSWENILAVALERNESDHCPIVLKNEEKYYGPTPFKVFDVWLDHNGVDKVISDAWNSVSVSGTRKDRNFLNKLKAVKSALKLWSKDTFGMIDNEIEVQKNIAVTLELKAETGNINAEEMETWKIARKDWIEKENLKTVMLKQKARVRWALEGDENTKFFYSII